MLITTAHIATELTCLLSFHSPMISNIVENQLSKNDLKFILGL